MTSPPALQLADTVLRPVRGHHAFETTVERLATAIRLGALVHGQRLPPERVLAERLAVSRTTLREAIAALRDSGLVTTTRGRGGGTVVTYRALEAGPAPTTLRRGAALADALDFRRVVEPGAAWLAAARELSADQRAWLVQSLDDALARQEDGFRRLADSRLHLAVATLSGTPMLIEAVTRAQGALGDLLRGIPVLRRNIDHSDDQHRAVVEAILRGDPDRARAVMEEHCDATSALLRGLIG